MSAYVSESTETRATLSTVGATVIIERRDRTILIGEIIASDPWLVTVMPWGCSMRTRIAMARIKTARVVLNLRHEQYVRVRAFQRERRSYMLRDLNVPARIRRAHASEGAR
jgi:hypothetical protein